MSSGESPLRRLPPLKVWRSPENRHFQGTSVKPTPGLEPGTPSLRDGIFA
jgi:hypothetical protein